MCILCEMRRAAAGGDEEVELTAEAIADPQLASGMVLMLGALLNKFGLEEFIFDPFQFDSEKIPALAFERDGPILKARIVQQDEIAAVVELTRGNPSVN